MSKRNTTKAVLKTATNQVLINTGHPNSPDVKQAWRFSLNQVQEQQSNKNKKTAQKSRSQETQRRKHNSKRNNSSKIEQNGCGRKFYVETEKEYKLNRRVLRLCWYLVHYMQEKRRRKEKGKCQVSKLDFRSLLDLTGSTSNFTAVLIKF